MIIKNTKMNLFGITEDNFYEEDPYWEDNYDIDFDELDDETLMELEAAAEADEQSLEMLYYT